MNSDFVVCDLSNLGFKSMDNAHHHVFELDHNASLRMTFFSVEEPTIATLPLVKPLLENEIWGYGSNLPDEKETF